MFILQPGVCHVLYSVAVALIFFQTKSTNAPRFNVKQIMSLSIIRAMILSLWFRFRTNYVSLNNNKLLLLPSVGRYQDDGLCVRSRQIVGTKRTVHAVWHSRQSMVAIQICQNCYNWCEYLRQNFCAFNVFWSGELCYFANSFFMNGNYIFISVVKSYQDFMKINCSHLVVQVYIQGVD